MPGSASRTGGLPPVLHPAAAVAQPRTAPSGSARRAGGGWFALGAVVLPVSLAVAMVIGSGDIGFAELGRVWGGHLGLDVEPLPRLLDSLVWDLRVPRVLMAAVVGAALGVCGAVLQAVTRNALADPYLLGVAHGASTGAVLVVVLGVGGGALSVSGGALVGALGSFALLLALLGKRGLGSVRVVLTGIVIGLLFEAVTYLILMASSDADTTRAVLSWLLGSMASARWDSVAVTAIVCGVGLVVLWLHSTALDGFAFGADTAASLGIDVRRTRALLLVTTALLVSVVVASVGAIAFVGLIVPHTVRFLLGPLHRVLLPASALAGAVFLVWVDALARVAFAPREVPVGVFTALVGVPIFLLVLRRRGEL
ncbi:iron ABC transporter permease [Actinokineospora sp. UTMC 2448]|uniref:FecCD family ABC transporter permease n=1 Tax=Actinokineospora sp. UTMC 2448 TaxID=2268449 RepID=UPI00216467E6|nr:iron ABC transporter permease [Actinokineospora sp. UTMC 2448]UVS80500.1 Iron-uptake system permease protein FeuC [Actinokineospora sp. UTMC 2448]